MSGKGTIAEARKKSYKSGIDFDDARRRRNETTMSISKNKREESLMKRRAMGTSTAPGAAEDAAALATTLVPSEVSLEGLAAFRAGACAWPARARGGRWRAREEGGGGGA